MRYATPGAFRRALLDHLKNRAKQDGVPMSRLQKQLVFERFLARLFREGNEPWVLKGGYALELRLLGPARTTRDLDLNVPPPLMADLLPRLEHAADFDLGDYFEFTILPITTELAGPPLGGYRLRVEARIDGRRFDRFPLDVGQGDETVRTPDRMPAQIDLAFAGLEAPVFAVYPLEDHFAEKLHAYTAPRERPTRVKDLVDMILLIELGLQPTPLLRQSIENTFKRYARHPMPSFLPKPPEAWQATFATLTDEVQLHVNTLSEAYKQLTGFLQSLDKAPGSTTSSRKTL